MEEYMPVHRVLRAAALLASSALLAVTAIMPAAAQPEEATVTVVAQDYHFEGLPTSVPAGTALELVNEGVEIHEIVVARKNDGVTESWDELIALPEEDVLGKVTILGPLFASQGETAEGTIALEQEGEYLAICFIPQGTTEMPHMPDPNAEPDPEAGPPAGLGDGPPHAFLGMMQEFVVTAPGTPPGPLPETAPSMAPEVGRVVELEMNAPMQILQGGEQVRELNVAVGETITFRITNTAGYEHNFFIGPEADLMANQVEGLPGIPDYTEGTEEFTWVVPENASELKFGCTVPGHYTLMNGGFVVGG
jgi:plastocyanin